MSGVAVPVYPIVEPFGSTAVNPTDITLPIPVDSQIGVQPAAASFTDGFPPATRTPSGAGGQPPFGQDMNGILYMMSVYCALAQAGQLCPFNLAVTEPPVYGYIVGAQVASALTPGRTWTNFLDGNINDPDVDDTGWAASDPLYATDAPLAGTYNDVALPGASDYALDVDTSDGDVIYTGFVAQRNGQRLILSNTGGNLLKFDPLTGSSAGNQIRVPVLLSVALNETATLEYVSTLNKWLMV